MRIPTKKLHALIWIDLHVIYGIEVSETSKKNTKTNARSHNLKQLVLKNEEKISHLNTYL